MVVYKLLLSGRHINNSCDDVEWVTDNAVHHRGFAMEGKEDVLGE